jgi:hypothetical protein
VAVLSSSIRPPSKTPYIDISNTKLARHTLYSPAMATPKRHRSATHDETRPTTPKQENQERYVTLAGGQTVRKRPRQFKMGGGQHCNAKKKSGFRCLLAAGWGTPHPGIGRCKFHGGLAPSHLRHAAKHEMKRLLGFEMEMDPIDALMWCIRLTAGEVHWLSHQLAKVPEDKWITDTIMGPQLHMWANQRRQSIALLAKYSKWAIDAGINERRVRLAEMYGESLARVLQGILQDLELTPVQREIAPNIVARHLAQLDSKNVFNHASPLVSGKDPADVEIPPEDVKELMQ